VDVISVLTRALIKVDKVSCRKADVGMALWDDKLPRVEEPKDPQMFRAPPPRVRLPIATKHQNHRSALCHTATEVSQHGCVAYHNSPSALETQWRSISLQAPSIKPPSRRCGRRRHRSIPTSTSPWDLSCAAKHQILSSQRDQDNLWYLGFA
jgi:hypothetical protein